MFDLDSLPPEASSLIPEVLSLSEVYSVDDDAPLCKAVFNDRVTIEVVHGDITEECTDAIVNSTNKNLQFGTRLISSVSFGWHVGASMLSLFQCSNC